MSKQRSRGGEGRSVRWQRTTGRMVVVAAAVGATVVPAATSLLQPVHADPGAPQKVIVEAATASTADGAVAQAGATATTDLASAGAAVASLTATQQSTVSSSGAVVVPDETMSTEDIAAPTHAPSAVFPTVTQAAPVVAAGTTGSGVSVAVLDTGIDANLPDLAGRVVDGVDLSGEGNPYADNYGHGTFVAGLVASSGASSSGAYVGEAPGASLVSVKVAGASGVTDAATVVRGIDWVIAHRQQDGIRVLNLSLGAAETMPTHLNPVDRAVEAAWRNGIVVVTSAGNNGPTNGTITSPGDDPMAVSVGALDDGGQTTPSGYSMTTFSSVGPTSHDGWFKPDLVAPGRSVISLAAPGSTIATQYPSARVGTSGFVGSGTSASAAITSGAAALLIAGHPQLSPAQVKGALLGAATAGPVGNPFVDGHGVLDVAGASSAAASGLSVVVQSDSSAASGQAVDLPSAWQRSTWAAANWSGASWNGASWNGASWNGASWNGASWNGASWNGASWNGASWNGASWNGASWNGASWNGASWNGASWNGASWNGASWNGASWNGASWNGASWN